MDKKYPEKLKEEKEKCWLQITAVLIVCLSAVSDGLLMAWTSPFMGKISNDKENYDITEAEASYFAIIPSIATVFSCILFAKLNDIIGRQKTLLLVAVPQLVSWILKAVAKNVILFYVSSLCSGASFGCVFSVGPIYISEIVSPKIRGTLGCCLTSLHFTGQFLVNILGNYFDVKTTSYICAPLVIVFFILFLLMPESPYYLLMKNKDVEAKAALQVLLRKSNVDDEFLGLKKDIERQMSEKGCWKELITIQSNRKALWIVTFLRITQQFGGTGVFVVSIQFIFERAGGAVRPEIATYAYTFSILPFYFLAGSLFDKTGRRPTFVISTILCGVVLICEAVYFNIVANYPEIDMGVLSWFPLVGMLFYVMFASFGPALIPTLVTGEIFSASIKSYGVIVITFVLGISGFLSTQLFFTLNSYGGLFAPFLLFGLMDLVGGVVAYFCLLETKGKTLEQIQQELKGNGERTMRKLC